MMRADTSDDEDRHGIWNTGLLAFQTPDVGGSPEVLLQYFTFVFWCNQIGLRTQTHNVWEKQNTSKLWQQSQYRPPFKNAAK
jgi:hypothetical protein